MDPIEKAILLANRGKNRMLITEMPGGYALMGQTQFLPGYSLLVPKRPVKSLNAIPVSQRIPFLKDMSILGDAIQSATGAQRMNYEILGNTSNFLHAHVFPRYASEPEKRLKLPVWLYSHDHWTDPKYQYNPKRDDPLKNKIASNLKKVLR